jgi:DNA-binding transcriptional LysR family regulator
VRVEQLEYIAAVARLGSFRRAAEAVHVPQPALSEHGRELLSHILTVLDSVDRLRIAADEQHQSSRVVRVGTVNTVTI